MIGSGYSQTSSFKELTFYAVVTPANIDIELNNYSIHINFNVEAYNFSDVANLSYEWSTTDQRLMILTPTSKQTQIKFQGSKGETVEGVITCKVSDSGLMGDYDAISQYKIYFKGF